MNKPQGHVAAVQRYSSRVPEDVSEIQVMVLGQQSFGDRPGATRRFLAQSRKTFDGADAPVHFDFAAYVDPQGHDNIFAIAYWQDTDSFTRWTKGFDRWWDGLDPGSLDMGYWRESFNVPVQRRETIAFKEYIRGLSACPRSRIEPMDESGYWGAARDRIPASAYEAFPPMVDNPLTFSGDRDTENARVRIKTPINLAVIRSGVSWRDCGEEQLRSYERNLKPKLDAGMEYLRTHPEESGCCSLRQVKCLDADGSSLKEAYSLGIFASLEHLERWSETHPSHLAIYTRAQAERKKYKEKLELRTYHEIYILTDVSRFEYVNCHNRTGLLPFFSAEYHSKT